jgi:DNA-binding CsgD family transcriptional regulator/PAS domain-containing protein
MSLTLNSQDQQLFTKALRAMVSLDIAEPAAWEIGVLRALKPLVRAERGGFFYVGESDLPVGASEDYDSKLQVAYRTYYGERDPGRRRLEAKKDPVFSRAMLFKADLRPLVRSECYSDFLAPAKMADSTGMALPDKGSGSPGVLALHRSDFGSEDFGRTAPALLRMLYPAFVSGWRARRQLSRRVDDLAKMIDALPEAAAVYAVDGRLLHANPRLVDLLGTEPRSDELRPALEHAAAARGCLLRGPAPELRPGHGLPPSCSGFRLRATLLDSLLPDPVVLVTLADPSDRLPTRATIRKRFGLTRRQAEVALLLAQRLSNPEIAERLFISPHTARRHTEAVKMKLGVHDRRLIAERLREPGDG